MARGLAVAGALIAAAGYMMMGMPGRSYDGPLDFTPEERALADRLRAHVAFLAAAERNDDLERPARYLEQQMADARSQSFRSGGRAVRNIETGSGSVVVGAHYDSVPGSPGADDNASGVAVLIELAGMGLPARFVAFANEEAPYFQSGEMGSHAWAARARANGEPVSAMISLEMLGYYRDEPGSQQYPAPLGWFYPDRGNFIGFVGDLGAIALVRRAIGAFREHTRFPSEGLAAPSAIPGVSWSDHWSFREHGFPAIMVTDTAFYRYPHYHLESDTAEKLDYLRMARVTVGLAATIRDLAK